MTDMPRNPSAHETRAKVMKKVENSVPLSALVGAGDLVLERLRALSSDVAERASHFEPPHFDPGAFRAPKPDPSAMDPRAIAKLAAEVRDLATKAQHVAAQYVSALGDQAAEPPDDAQPLPTKVQAAFTDLVSGAVAWYGELAGRGHEVVRGAGGTGGDVSTEPLSAEGVRAAEAAQAGTPTPVRVTPAPRRPVRKSAAGKATVRKVTVKKATVKKATAKKAAGEAAAGTKATVKKATVVKQTPAKSTAAKKATKKDAAATPAAQAPAMTASSSAATVQKPSARKAPGQKKAAAKKAPATPSLTDPGLPIEPDTQQTSVAPGPTS
jgi:hypothetical protein